MLECLLWQLQVIMILCEQTWKMHGEMTRKFIVIVESKCHKKVDRQIVPIPLSGLLCYSDKKHIIVRGFCR